MSVEDVRDSSIHLPPAISVCTARWALAGAMVVAMLLLAKQLAMAQIATKDACAYYLPLARLAAAGDPAGVEHPMIPPVYVWATAWAAGLFAGWADAFETAGRMVSAASVLATVLLVYVLAAGLATRRVALAAAALAACNPWVIRLGANVGPESLYSLWLTATVAALAVYWRRPSVAMAAAAAATSALAPLTRSEGLFLPVVTAAALAFFGLARRCKSAVARHLLIWGVITLVFWAPRARSIQRQTGFYALDIRMLYMVPPIRRHLPAFLGTPPHQRAAVAVGSLGSGRAVGAALDEAQESLLMVIGPVTWAMLLLWFLGRRYLGEPARSQVRAPRGPVLLIAAICVFQLIAVAPVKMDRRYVVSIAPLLQVFAGLGLVSLVELLRLLRGVIGRLGRSIPAQLVGLALLVGAHAAWSVMMTNVGARHAELRALGALAGEMLGPGRTYLATSPEAAYYARGSSVLLMWDDPRASLSMPQLLSACRQHRVDAIVLREGETWADGLEALPADSPAIIASAGRGPEAKLIDAAALAAAESPP